MKKFTPLSHQFPGIASILRNGAILTGTQWAEAGLRAVYVLLIARLLGPELYGVWSFTTTTYAFVLAFAFFGLETLIPLRLGRDQSAGDFLGTTFLLRLGLLLLTAAVLAVYAVTFERDATISLALLIVLPALVGRGLVLWGRVVLLGRDQSAKAFGMAVALRCVEIAAGLIALASGAGIFVLLALHAVTWVAEAVWSFRRITRDEAIPLRINRLELREILRKGGILGMSAAALAALMAGPLIGIRYLSDDLQTVGQMGLAMQVATLAVMGAQGVLSAALPVLSRASAKSDPRLVQYPFVVAGAVVCLFGFMIPMAYFWGPGGISALIGSDYALAGTLLAPALLVGGLSVLPIGFGQILVTQGRLWPGVFSGGLAVLALLILLPAMVSTAGAEGALYAAALAWSLRALIMIVWALSVSPQSEP